MAQASASASANGAKAKTGRLTVTIHEVRRLFNTQSIGAQDPYVRLECGDLKYRTKVVKDGGSMATFEQQFLFDLKGAELFVSVEVWAEKALGDDFIGRAVIPIVQFFTKKLDPQWTRLGRATGSAEKVLAATAAAQNPFAGELLLSSEFVDDDKSADAKDAAAAAAVAQLTAQLQYCQQAFDQKCRDADAETKAFEAKIAELQLRNAEQKQVIAKMEAIIAGLRAAAAATSAGAAAAGASAAAAAGDVKSGPAQVAALERQIEALRPAPVVEEYYENQRYAPLVGWKTPFLPYDPKPFTNARLQECTRNQIHAALPQGWAWASEWTIDCTSHPVEHVTGWEYAIGFEHHTSWHPANSATDTVRRRRWVRTRVVQVFAGADAQANAAVAAAAVAAGVLPAADVK